ncbi:MAG: HD domain-containing protein [Corallococcus sp.]|nr:HD domain-containing protein [Bacillota bacterium]MCM1533616.1 HD domain-containing protein [Corallococcus sp.]
MSDIDLSKNEFTDIYTSNISREGADKLLEYLSNSDFFTAPASGKFHLAVSGGLCKHSVNVYKRLVELVKREYGEDYASVYSDETLAICGLLHDVCKVNYYVVDTRNVKENGTWKKVPYFKVEEKFPYGHGEKSVFIISQYLKLTADEAMAINWHMGGFDERVKGGSYALSEAYAKYKLALLMHVADLTATYLDEERGLKL